MMLAWDSQQSRLVAKLCDFGSAAHLDHLPVHGFQSRVGTALWMPPEMLSRSRAGPELRAQLEAGDVYSYGMVLWELLTGAVPWVDVFKGEGATPGSMRETRQGYSDGKVANRDTKVWHGATENGP